MLCQSVGSNVTKKSAAMFDQHKTGINVGPKSDLTTSYYLATENILSSVVFFVKANFFGFSRDVHVKTEINRGICLTKVTVKIKFAR